MRVMSFCGLVVLALALSACAAQPSAAPYGAYASAPDAQAVATPTPPDLYSMDADSRATQAAVQARYAAATQRAAEATAVFQSTASAFQVHAQETALSLIARETDVALAATSDALALAAQRDRDNATATQVAAGTRAAITATVQAQAAAIAATDAVARAAEQIDARRVAEVKSTAWDLLSAVLWPGLLFLAALGLAIRIWQIAGTMRARIEAETRHSYAVIDSDHGTVDLTGEKPELMLPSGDDNETDHAPEPETATSATGRADLTDRAPRVLRIRDQHGERTVPADAQPVDAAHIEARRLVLELLQAAMDVNGHDGVIIPRHDKLNGWHADRWTRATDMLCPGYITKAERRRTVLTGLYPTLGELWRAVRKNLVVLNLDAPAGDPPDQDQGDPDGDAGDADDGPAARASAAEPDHPGVDYTPAQLAFLARQLSPEAMEKFRTARTGTAQTA